MFIFSASDFLIPSCDFDENHNDVDEPFVIRKQEFIHIGKWSSFIFPYIYIY